MYIYKQVIEEIIGLFEEYGNYQYTSENITLTEHMILCAMMAESENCDIEMIIAAFLHDIGHLLILQEINQSCLMSHDFVAKQYLLSKGFNYRIASLVGNHTQAKKYFVKLFPNYYQNPSKTYQYQSEIMTDREMLQFKKDPFFKDLLIISEFDDRSKISNVRINSLEYYRKLLTDYFDNIK